MNLPDRGALDRLPSVSVGLTMVIVLVLEGSLITSILAKDYPVILLLTLTVYFAVLIYAGSFVSKPFAS